MSACNRRGKMTLRVALLSSAALAFVAALAQPADAAVRRAKAVDSVKKPNPEKDGFSEAKKGVQQIVVSIGSQRVTLFSNGVPVAQGAISTGMPGHPTPMGVFSIIQKDRYHHSNIYSGAPMPYMQRITWSGVAMHEGVVPGHPASHGCIRLTHGFAAALWPTTRLGVRVIVSRNDLAPTDFEHPKLFEPRPKPSEPPIAMTGPTLKLQQVAESANISTDARALDAEPAKPAANDADPPKPVPPSGRSSSQPAKHTGQVAVFVSRKEHKLFVRQGFVPLFEMPVTIEDGDRPLGTHVFTAMGPRSDGSGMRWNLITVVSSPQKEAERPRARNKKHGEPAKPVVVETRTASTAAEALDRIQLPKEAVDRISELLTPGSSLIVSDLGSSYETGQGTEFVVLAH
jgi:L,D-transpeptidase catalytic domain